VSARRTGERIAGLVYGTIVVMGVIAASSEGLERDPARIAALVVATSFVFWLAHVYAHAIELSVVTNERLTSRGIKEVAVHEGPILSAAVLPAGALLLGAFDLVGDRLAVWLALAAGTFALAAQGLAYARIEKLSAFGTATLVIANLMLGLAIVGLKVFVSH
jgi:uncharacterized membrane protein YvlD (DUF360 family)